MYLNRGFNPLPKPVAKEKKPKKIRAKSVKREKLDQEYTNEAKRFIKDKRCAVHRNLSAECVHHMKGKASPELLMDKKYWLAVSFKAHRFIEDNPKWAKKMRFSLDRNS